MFVDLLTSLFWWNFRLSLRTRPQMEKQKPVSSWLLDGESKIQFSFFTLFIKNEICDHVYAEMIAIWAWALVFYLDRWGLTRHFHYVPEILSAFFWTVPALFDHVSMPYIVSYAKFSWDCINYFSLLTCSFSHISMWYFWPYYCSTEQRGMTIDAHQSM
jgi:hypothetical protein